MEFKEFDDAFDAFVSLYRGSKDNSQAPNIFDIFKKPDIYAKLLDYYFNIKTISTRLEEDIKEYSIFDKQFMEKLLTNQDGIQLLENLPNTLAKLNLDVTDFYIHTRIFLDALYMSIKSFLTYAGNKQAILMKDNFSAFLDKEKMLEYKNKIDSAFFGNLEQKVSCFREFTSSRNKIVHRCNSFFIAEIGGKSGKDLYGKVGTVWGSQTIKPILAEFQVDINNLSSLMRFLANNLPLTIKKR
jgi:hypothetical protein